MLGMLSYTLRGVLCWAPVRTPVPPAHPHRGDRILVTLVKIEAGNRRVGDSLHVVIEKQYSSSPAVREFAKRSLREVAQWYEESTARGGHDINLRLSQDHARDMIAKITRYPNPEYPYDVLAGVSRHAFTHRMECRSVRQPRSSQMVRRTQTEVRRVEPPLL
jgi:hypothetical protein